MEPSFHLQMQTGALVLAVVAIMALGYSLWFTSIIFATFIVYATYTTLMMRRRIAFQRRVNELDSRAGSLLLDSLMLSRRAAIARGAGRHR